MGDQQLNSDLESLVALLKDLPYAHLHMLQKVIAGNDTTDWTKPVIRPAFDNSWILFFLIHVVIGLLGTILSLWMVVNIVSCKLHETSTGKYLLNVAANNLCISLFELPVNFIVMLYENWILGKGLCYLASVLPYTLLHSTMITFIILTIDRYRNIAHSNKKQLNSTLCLVVAWISSTCASLPILTYVHYRDISHIHPRLANNGLCWSTGDDYSRIVFGTVFTLPIVVIALLLTKISAELKTKDVLYNLYSLRDRSRTNDNDHTIYADVNSLNGDDSNEQYKDKTWLIRQKHLQRHLVIMILLWALCWLPIKVLGIVNINTMETEQSMYILDIAHMILLPMSAVCTITTPISYKLMTRSFTKTKYEINNDHHQTTLLDNQSNQSVGGTSLSELD